MTQSKSEEHLRQNRRIVKQKNKSYIWLVLRLRGLKDKIKFQIEWSRLSVIESREIHRRMRLQTQKEARGICPWCAEMIAKNHPAYKTCTECPEFDKPYIHIRCAVRGICVGCDYGVLRKTDRVQ